MHFIDFTYIVNWVQHGTMTIDLDAWFDIAYKRGQGFSDKRNIKIITLISEDDRASYESVQYALANKKRNPKLADLILRNLDPFYNEHSGNGADA